MAVLRDPSNGREFALGARTVVGRDPTCEVHVSAGQASRRHAAIVQEGSAYFIEDLGSANGTGVNGKSVQGRQRLQANDQIEIGGLIFVFQSGAPAAAEAAAAAENEELRSITSTLNIDAGERVSVAAEAKLRAILEISKSLSNVLHLEAVLPKILDSLFTVFPRAERAVVLLFDPRTAQLKPRAVRQRNATRTAPPISQTILSHALQTGQALLSADAGVDERFDITQSVRSFGFRCVMCVPMLSQEGAPLGVIQVDGETPRTAFNHDDLDVLVCVGAQAARAVELARLYEARRDQEAAEIQKSFLPSRRPSVPGLRFFDHYSAAQNIGGDYYDYIPLPGNRLALALGDVAGKGTPAALLMARLSGFARFCFAAEPDVGKAAEELNAALCTATNVERFVTFVAAVIDLESFAVTLVNAGHPPPLLRRAGRVSEIGKDQAGLPLAVLLRPYETATVTLEPGDALVIYTDGISEARNPKLDVYGLGRLTSLIESGPPGAEQLGAAIVADVRRFSAERPQNDDITLLCVDRVRTE